MTPNELVLTFGGLHVCVQFDVNRRRNATVRVSTDGQTHARTDAKRFYYLSHAICYIAMGQITMKAYSEFEDGAVPLHDMSNHPPLVNLNAIELSIVPV